MGRIHARVLLALVLFVACGKKPVTAWETGEVPRPGLRESGLAVAPVVRLAEVPAPPLAPLPPPSRIEDGLADANLPSPTVLDPVADADFLRNEFAGNIRFGGGFVRTGGVALEVRARLVELGEQDRYDAQGRAWLDAAVDALLDAVKVEARDAAAPEAPPPIDRLATRGLHPEDGTDNLNLPRTTLAPRDAGRALDAAGAGYLLVPYLRSYYTHNGGWFLGHESGCMAGARVEALLVLYDAATGKVVWSLDALGKHVQDRQGQASRAELDQYLLWAEDQVERQLERGFLR